MYMITKKLNAGGRSIIDTQGPAIESAVARAEREAVSIGTEAVIEVWELKGTVTAPTKGNWSETK